MERRGFLGRLLGGVAVVVVGREVVEAAPNLDEVFDQVPLPPDVGPPPIPPQKLVSVDGEIYFVAREGIFKPTVNHPQFTWTGYKMWDSTSTSTHNTSTTFFTTSPTYWK